MEISKVDNEWPIWVRVVLLGLFICFVIAFDFLKAVPVTVATFLGYLSIPFALGANIFNRRSKFRWIFVGVTLGLILACVIVSLYVRHGGGTIVR